MRYSMCKSEYPELHTGTYASQSTPFSTEWTPLSTILWRVGCTHSVWRFTQVYDIVNKASIKFIQISEFRIRNSEFRIRNSELWIDTEMKKRAIWAIVLYK